MEINSEYGMQQLCNAVVILAAKDYRAHMGYLKRHPKTPELMEKVRAEKAERERKLMETIERQKDFMAERAYRKWIMEGHEGDFDREEYKKSIDIPIPKRGLKPTKHERVLEGIMKHEAGVKEVEDFFRSKWYTVLTSVDGKLILRKLQEEFADESD